MEDLDTLKTPDAYATNYGVDVWENLMDPQHGQIKVKVKHNHSQSTRLQMGLEQAKELQAKLREAILAAEYDLGAMWRFVSESYDRAPSSPDRQEWTNKDIAEFVREFHVEGLDAFRKGQA